MYMAIISKVGLGIDRIRFPKGTSQAHLLENGRDLIGAVSTKIRPEPVLIPGPSQDPSFLQIKNSTSLVSFAFIPTIQVFFRPEELHGCSGMNQIIVPVSERHRDVNNFAISIYLAALNV